MKKAISLFLSFAIVATLFTACSNTRQAIGVDTMNSFIRTGKWTSLAQDVYAPGSNTAVRTDILTDGKYLEFKNDNKAHIYNSGGTELSAADYRIVDSKTILYNGVQYRIQENFVSTISTMTLVNESTTGKTVLTFRR